jgi:hypothetical protein
LSVSPSGHDGDKKNFEKKDYEPFKSLKNGVLKIRILRDIFLTI